jgi:hypothetical protein
VAQSATTLLLLKAANEPVQTLMPTAAKKPNPRRIPREKKFRRGVGREKKEGRRRIPGKSMPLAVPSTANDTLRKTAAIRAAQDETQLPPVHLTPYVPPFTIYCANAPIFSAERELEASGASVAPPRRAIAPPPTSSALPRALGVTTRQRRSDLPVSNLPPIPETSKAKRTGDNNNDDSNDSADDANTNDDKNNDEKNKNDDNANEDGGDNEDDSTNGDNSTNEDSNASTNDEDEDEDEDEDNNSNATPVAAGHDANAAANALGHAAHAATTTMGHSANLAAAATGYDASLAAAATGYDANLATAATGYDATHSTNQANPGISFSF